VKRRDAWACPKCGVPGYYQKYKAGEQEILHYPDCPLKGEGEYVSVVNVDIRGLQGAGKTRLLEMMTAELRKKGWSFVAKDGVDEQPVTYTGTPSTPVVIITAHQSGEE